LISNIDTYQFKKAILCLLIQSQSVVSHDQSRVSRGRKYIFASRTHLIQCDEKKKLLLPQVAEDGLQALLEKKHRARVERSIGSCAHCQKRMDKKWFKGAKKACFKTLAFQSAFTSALVTAHVKALRTACSGVELFTRFAQTRGCTSLSRDSIKRFSATWEMHGSFT